MTFRVEDFMLAAEGAAHATGGARRRRERPLRAYLRYSRMSVAVALAENNHHPATRRQTKARARKEGHRVEHEAPRRQKPPPPQPELFHLFEEEPGGSQPPCLREPREPQETVQQCTVEQLAGVVPVVQILEIPGPQGGDKVVEVLRKLDVPSVEQVIAVPMISLDWVHQRSPFAEGRTVGGSADGGRMFTGGHCRASPGAEGNSGTG